MAVADRPLSGLAQRLEALERANHVRSYRARLKRDLAARRCTIADVLSVPEVATMTVFDLLVAQPRWGRERSRKLLKRLEVSTSRLVVELTENQRRKLLRELGLRSGSGVSA